MRKVLITFIIFSLISPWISEGNKIVTLYEWKTVSGIQWREIGDKDFHAKYKGNIILGKPHGFGTIIYPDRNRYHGEWLNGLFHGQGMYSISDKYFYTGDYKLGFLWNGTIKRKDGTIVYKVINWKKIKQ